MILNKKKIHFVGIGGIGMSGIAHVLLEMGYSISGSDAEPNDITRKLEVLGGTIFAGHNPSNVLPGAEAVVYSTSISRDNPELEAARRRRIPIVHRACVLGELFNDKKGIAVTGTHGKTTTTSMIAIMLKRSGMDPTAIIGGEVRQFDGNAGLGSGGHIVAEADESDSSFLNLKPLYEVITNIEMEHVDHFRTIGAAKEAYRSFVAKLKKGGTVFYNYDDPVTSEVMSGFKGNSMTFGFSKEADIYPRDIESAGFNTSFGCVYRKRYIGKVKLRLPGGHNIANALAAILVGLKLGIPFSKIAVALGEFEGALRRFQLKAKADGVMLIDDYAHHPTEIRAVLKACRAWKARRLIVIFQPHRYTRTKFLADDFGRSFSGVDKLILTDIYAASEKPIPGLSSKTIRDKIYSNGILDVVVMKRAGIPDHIMKIKRLGDIIVVMGAGNIKKTADEIAARLTSRDIAHDLKQVVRGPVRAQEPLRSYTSFRIGGPADALVEPRDVNDLKRVIKFARDRSIPIFVIGNGSNLLVKDEGFRGIIVRLSYAPAFAKIAIDGTRIRVGAGYSLPKLVTLACRKGLGGLESLVGIPGTIGGAIAMNAGGWTNPVYKNIGSMVRSLKVMGYDGKIRSLAKEDIEFGYRYSSLGEYIVLEATLELEESDATDLLSSCTRFLRMKREKQALDVPSAGCIFKNPEKSQFTCGQMIDTLGLKGYRIGGAEISQKHANFVVNRSGASCKDVLAVIERIREKVAENYGMSLELEVKIL